MSHFSSWRIAVVSDILINLVCPQAAPALHRGTSLIRNSASLGPYGRTAPRALWWSQGGGLFLMSEVPLQVLRYVPSCAEKVPEPPAKKGKKFGNKGKEAAAVAGAGEGEGEGVVAAVQPCTLIGKH